MQIAYHPERVEWEQLIRRPLAEAGALLPKIKAVLDEVRTKGDSGLRELTERFDGARITNLKLTPDDIGAGAAAVTDDLRTAIDQAKKNIEVFHNTQRETPQVVETMPGVRCWRKSVAIEKVGLYIPGGTAPLFSTLLMLGIPAKLAGCREIILCSPPDHHGNLHPAILYAARVVGIESVFRLGGVQAIGAMAYGTESVPRVYKIFGPGNQYVTGAKQLVQQEGVAIDMPAGPSEVCVLADATANPAFVAADLLSQAEHGADSQVLLVTTDEGLAGSVMNEVQRQVQELPRRDLAERSLAHSRIIVLGNMPEALELVNEYAPEHLIINCANPGLVADCVVNAGSVFLGPWSPESAGDYASGTNHTLPTNGYARAYSGVSMDSFVRKITYQELSREGLENLGPAVMTMAEAEGLRAHAQAVALRLKQG
ncbi:MAG TPA: histidinol dehydrogenase [Dinghuibacter sp.]|uniref:histidinol dehydrogenase n=1 Tax=Dinghuibacter sp. TaxID=2024697 RepID=UPI002D06C17E|nr:histidinol dehydrogenase [Dinghuibacter sp.]HTJ13750.1 histidinol dehydrogenase [Dinghuibacter sp.]